MRALGGHADSAARVYFTGGASAVLLGWRATTIDVDVKLVPDSDALLRAIPALKESLQINVEVASPPDFIPVPDGWEDRSPFIAQEGKVSFHHFDFYAQAMAKIERGHVQDLADVENMVRSGLVDPPRAVEYFGRLKAQLHRYPAIDARSFARAVDAALGGA